MDIGLSYSAWWILPSALIAFLVSYWLYRKAGETEDWPKWQRPSLFSLRFVLIFALKAQSVQLAICPDFRTLFLTS